MSINLVSTPNNISFTKENKTWFINHSSPHFQYYKHLIEENCIELLDNIDTLYNQQLVEISDCLSFKNERFYYQETIIPEFIDFAQFLIQKLPLQPILKFAQKYQQCSKEVQQDLQIEYNQKNLTLTWDGNLILYKRASWNKNRNWTNKDFDEIYNSPFTPGTIVHGKNLICGDLNWTLNFCPDTGPIFDLVVNPIHLCAKDKNDNFGGVRVSEYMHLSQLEENLNSHSKNSLHSLLAIIETRTENNSFYCVRHPYTVAHLSRFLAHQLSSSQPQYQTVIN